MNTVEKHYELKMAYESAIRTSTFKAADYIYKELEEIVKTHNGFHPPQFDRDTCMACRLGNV